MIEAEREAQGRFAPGSSGNPSGRPRGRSITAEARIRRIIERRAPTILETAFEQAPENANIMAAVLQYLAVTQRQ